MVIPMFHRERKGQACTLSESQEATMWPSTTISLRPALEHFSQTPHAEMHEVVCNGVKTMSSLYRDFTRD